ncbi:uncharacterized protein EAE97_000375 [Botrytis byssoidea]|uniref:Uncharacterized protein n=1 Tax=Botrytis byssoidea TaxID=139641 RepID=A0A9P5IYZ3_9HELO|nr:uncharacterized protein EAE97_000375 [Botrytis byssoidea]KAF7955116.1 hypothetical protein EAE97_000375 [Botrytis byssoidea]
MSQQRGTPQTPVHEDLSVSDGDALVITIDYKRPAREQSERTGSSSLLEHLPVVSGCESMGVQIAQTKIDYGEDTDHATQLLTKMRGIFDKFNIEELDVELHLPWYNHRQLHAAVPLVDLEFSEWTLHYISGVITNGQSIQVKQNGNNIILHDWLDFDENKNLAILLNSHPSPGIIERERRFIRLLPQYVKYAKHIIIHILPKSGERALRDSGYTDFKRLARNAIKIIDECYGVGSVKICVKNLQSTYRCFSRAACFCDFKSTEWKFSGISKSLEKQIKYLYDKGVCHMNKWTITEECVL